MTTRLNRYHATFLWLQLFAGVFFLLLGVSGQATAQAVGTNQAERAQAETQLKAVLHLCPKTMAQAIGMNSQSITDLNQLMADCNKEVAERQLDTKKALEKTVDDFQKQSLERDRKSVDWWLAAVASMLTVITILVAGVGIWMQRSQKEAVKNQTEAFNAKFKEVEQQLKVANKSVENIKTHEKKAEQAAIILTKATQNLQNIKPETSTDASEKANNQEKTQANAQIVLKSDNASDEDKLRALALKAYEEKNKKYALLLWQALLEKLPTDAQAAFFIAYLAHDELDEARSQDPDAWQKVIQAYELADKSDANQNPNERNIWIFNNWGYALNQQAQALSSSQPEQAQALWAKAGEQYALALRIKPNKHEAANNWGTALSNQAQALSSSQPEQAQALWAKAGEQYALALRIKPDAHEAAYNWITNLLSQYQSLKGVDASQAQAYLTQAQTLLEQHVDASQGTCCYNLACVYALQAKVGEATERLVQAASFGKLPTAKYMCEDNDFDGIRQHPSFVTWWEKTFPGEPIV
jgi:hypothetical protein